MAKTGAENENDFKQDAGQPRMKDDELDSVRKEMSRAIITFNSIFLLESPKRYFYILSDIELISFKEKIDLLASYLSSEVERRGFK